MRMPTKTIAEHYSLQVQVDKRLTTARSGI
jgi:hypothetical protein